MVFVGERRQFPGGQLFAIRFLDLRSPRKSRKTDDMTSSSSAGGAAAAGGTNFEARAAGWYGVYMLAEAGAPALPGRAADARVLYLRCQTGESVDDILVGFSDGAHDFVQAKRSLSLEVAEDSELAKSLDQCVRQVVASHTGKGERPWDRPLDPARDRLVLAVGPTSSKPIREDLHAVLERVGPLHPGQPLSDATVNAAEQHALVVVSDHIRGSWKTATGTDATDDDLRTILSLLTVVELDVDANGAGETLALLLLRSAVVHDPTQDAAAWSLIWGKTAQLAQGQSGIDRIGLEKVLRDAGIRMRGVRSYEQDVARLKAVSADTLALVERFAFFESGGAIVKLPRLVNETISTLAVSNSFAIVGEPGAGKSGSLFEAAAALSVTPTAVVVLQALDAACRSLGELRLQLGLEHTVIEVLANWREANTGVLFIDALDAARDEESARTLRDLMALVSKKAPRFTVVASIRSFDLKQGTHFQNVFRGSLPTVPPEYQRSDFAQARHVFVPRLTDQELGELAGLAPLLRPLIDSALGELRELLRVPFNIQLLAQLVDDGAALSALQPLRTQGELLDLYWNHRVRRDAQGDARETLLRRVCERMVAARQLRVDRTTLALDSSGSALLHDLLSAHVLIELESHARVLTFSHHVLFDYAAARLLLPVDAGDLAAYLASDPALLFVLRPSLVLAFHERWRQSRAEFWATTLRLIADDRIEAVGEVIGPVTAVDLATNDEDWSPVFEALAGTDPAMQSAAAKAIQYVVGSLRAGSHRPMVGADAGPWAALAERIATSLRPDLTGALSVLLQRLTERIDQATPEQQASAGRAARLLLQYVERELPANRNLVVASLTFVARTIATDPAASTQLLRACLDPDRVRQVGYEELPALAREVERLIVDPVFVADLYTTTFSFKEESKDATSLGASAILPLRSNRAQDYQGAYYALADAFPAFFKASPLHATDALVRAVDAFVQQRHPSSGNVEEETFALRDANVRLRTDYSETWDKTPHEDTQRLLVAFEKGLVTLADGGEVQTLRGVLAVILKTNRMAAVWRRLLRAGAQRPDSLGVLLLPLLQRPVFLAYDTSKAAVRLAHAIYPHLAAQERERLEEVLLLSLSGIDDKARPARQRLLDECVGGLPRDLIQKQVTRDLADHLGAAREGADRAAPRSATSGDDDDDEDFEVGTQWLDADDAMLAFEGVNVSDEANASIRTLITPVEAFGTKHTNTEPDQTEIEQILPAVAVLEEAISSGEANGVHPRLLEHARVAVAEAYSVIPKSRALPLDHPALQCARQGLLQAAESASPEVNDDIEANWDEHGSGWGPADRIEAAQGLLYLARRKETCDSEILDALENLAADPVAAVRYQIAPNLNFLYYTARERMWSILETRIAGEQRGSVAKGLLGSLDNLIHADDERVAALTIQLAKRFDAHEAVTRASVEVLTVMLIWRGTTGARAQVDDIIANVSTKPKAAGAILHVIREPLAHGDPGDEKAAAVRKRAFEITKQLVENALDAYRTDIVGHDFSGDPEAEIENARSIIGIIDGAARALYFASGAHNRSEGRSSPVDEPKQRRFYTEAADVIDLLIATGLPPATHSLVKMFESMIGLEPEEVFFRIRDLIRAGHAAGYSQESLAIGLVVRIVERYLADYRHLFQANANLRAALSEILNLFIQAGWPQALRLASRLEDIFR